MENARPEPGTVVLQISDPAQIDGVVEALRKVDAGNLVIAAPPRGEMVSVHMPRGNAERLIARTSILYGKAIGDYVRIVSDEGRFLIRGRISEMESRWGPHGFIRTHRAYVINARRAVEIDRNANGTALVELTGGERIPVSRRQLTTVRAALTA